MKKIAIVCVAYNRLEPLKRLVQSLEHAWYDDMPVDLIISIDKSNTDVVENYADTVKWNNGNFRVCKHVENLGLRKHILSIGDLLENEYEAVVVLEDDIIVSPNFMRYVRQCVDKYYDDERIAGISLYKSVINSDSRMPFEPLKNEFDVFFVNYAMSWGEVWMRKQWLEFRKWYNDNSAPFYLDYLPSNINRWSDKSWLKYHIRYCYETNKFFVFPYESLATNNDEAGTHVKKTRTINQTMLLSYSKLDYNLPTFDEQYIKYDTFFSPLFLAKYLKVEENELTIDLFGKKKCMEYKRYVLSLQVFPFKIVRSYSLFQKPFEQNVINDIKGEGIYLYDTSISAHNDNFNYFRIFEYYFGESYKHVIRNIPLTTIIKSKILEFIINLKRKRL